MNEFDKVDRIFVMFQAPLAKSSAVAALLFFPLFASPVFYALPIAPALLVPFLLARCRLTIS